MAAVSGDIIELDLPPVAKAVGQLAGLVNADGTPNKLWFGDAVAELEAVRRRLDVLADALPALLGDAKVAPGLPGSSWYALPNPKTRTPTALSVVAVSGATNQLGVGVISHHEIGSDGAVEALVYVPLFAWAPGPNAATFQHGPLEIAVTVDGGAGSPFPALTVAIAQPLAAQPPTWTVTLGTTPYHDLKSLEQGAATELEDVLAACAVWLGTNVGASASTVAQVLEGAGLIAGDGSGGYKLTLDTLVANGPIGFAKGALGALASASIPLLALPPDGGIYVVHDDGDWGLRVKGELSLELAGEEVSLAVGTTLAGDSDADDWLHRSLGKSAKDDAGLSVFVVNDSGGFTPRFSLVDVGLDVGGVGGKPLLDVDGYTLAKFQARAYLDSSDGWPHGFAVALDGVGFPVVPSAGGGDASNPVAHDLVAGGGEGGAGDTQPANPVFSASIGKAWDTAGPGELTVRLSDPDGAKTDTVWIPAQRAFGPLHMNRIGIEWVDPNPDLRLSVLLDAGVKLSLLEVDLLELALGIPLAAPGDIKEYTLDLDGLALSYESPALQISGGLVKDISKRPVEYDGEALIKTAKWGLSAIGSYASMDGTPSMFIFAQLDATLGGPPFFFVTGLCAGFGYNRSLRTPAIGELDQFPLLAGVADPSKVGGQNASPADALKALAGGDKPWIAPERGANWLAAGVQFTSFELANSNAVAIIVFGDQFRVLIVGISRIKLAQAGEQFAYVELDLEVVVDPSQGLFSAEAVVAPSSYIISPDCHLTGGFAFYVWYGGKHAGDFVLTVGGYHPAFEKPDLYPEVPRLGFSWFPSSDVTIQGDAYFALTPSCVMGGGGLDVEFHSGDLRAWFTAHADFLFHWKPFWFEGGLGISIGASYKLDLVFVSLTVTVELGADLEIHGPPTGGKAHIDWYIISFTVPFGDQDGQADEFQEWKGFAPLLPQPDGTPKLGRLAAAAVPDDADLAHPLRAAISDGLLRTAPDGTWLVRADALTIDIDTAFPATQVVLDGPAPYADPATGPALAVRPMGVQSVTSVLTVTVCREPGDLKQELHGFWTWNVTTGAVPAAMWGAPPTDPATAPPPRADTLPGHLVSVTGLTPKQAQPVGPPPMPIVDFDYAAIDKSASDWLPLASSEDVIDRAPVTSDAALETIDSTIVAAQGARDDIYAALVALGADPGQNGDVQAVVSDIAVDFADEPLLGAPWVTA